MLQSAKNANYDSVFILEPPLFYKKDSVRQSSLERAEKLHTLLIETYEKLGYKPILVPLFKRNSTDEEVEARANFICQKIGEITKKS